MLDRDARVRVEAIRSFAKLKADVPEAAGALVACMRDDDIEVRRDALRQAVRWAPAGEERAAVSETPVASLASGDREGGGLASEARGAAAGGRPGNVDKLRARVARRTARAATRSRCF